MNTFSIIALAYLFVGIVLGFVVILKCSEKWGEGNPIAALCFFLCCFYMWPFFFPVIMFNLYRKDKKN